MVEGGGNLGGRVEKENAEGHSAKGERMNCHLVNLRSSHVFFLFSFKVQPF